MIKVYRIKVMSASILVYANKKPLRVKFEGGVRSTGFHGQYSTSDETIQKAIEASPEFGNKLTHKIYLSDIIGEDGNFCDTVTVKKEKPKAVQYHQVEEIKGFQAVKQLLISKYGISADELKNFKQVEKKLKDLNLSYEL